MNRLHNHLRNRYKWYDVWHKNTNADIYHLVLLLGISTLVYLALSSVFSKVLVLSQTSTESAILTDTIPPSTPTNLSGSAVSDTQIDLSWTASTDNVGVQGYDVFRGAICNGSPFVRLAQVTTNSYSDKAVYPTNCYDYYVRAVDTSGNVSQNSNTLSLTTPRARKNATPYPSVTPTPNPDKTPPTAPTNLTATLVAPEFKFNLTWNGSRDDVGVRKYFVYVKGRDGKPWLSEVINATYRVDETLMGYSHKAPGVPLEENMYWVAAVDEAENVSPLSNPSGGTMPGKEGYGNIKGFIYSSAGGIIPGNDWACIHGPLITLTLSKGNDKVAARTCPDGSYRLINVPVGTYKVTVTASGYLSLTTEVTVTNKSATLKDFTLKSK